MTIENIPQWASGLAVIALFMGAVAYLLSVYKKSGATAWRENYDAIKERSDELEKENHTKDRQIAELQGQVSQLTEQVKQLTALVMGEKVPEALKHELTGVANRVIKRIGELEDNTASALGATADRILTQLPPKENP